MAGSEKLFLCAILACGACSPAGPDSKAASFDNSSMAPSGTEQRSQRSPSAGATELLDLEKSCEPGPMARSLCMIDVSLDHVRKEYKGIYGTIDQVRQLTSDTCEVHVSRIERTTIWTYHFRFSNGVVSAWKRVESTVDA